MAKDLYHNLVKEALIKDGWTITADPYRLKWNPEWQIDLGAEKLISAEKENQQIAVEIKSFLKSSFPNEFHSVLGQYISYFHALSNTDKNRILFLAIPSETWHIHFQLEGIKSIINQYRIKIIVYNIISKEIEQWIT